MRLTPGKNNEWRLEPQSTVGAIRQAFLNAGLCSQRAIRAPYALLTYLTHMRSRLQPAATETACWRPHSRNMD